MRKKSEKYFVVKHVIWDDPVTKAEADRTLKIRRADNKDSDETFTVQKATTAQRARYNIP